MFVKHVCFHVSPSTPSYGVHDYWATCYLSLFLTRAAYMRMWFHASHLTRAVLFFCYTVFSLIHKNMITVHQSSAYGHGASHRGGHNPWKLNFLIQITFSFLLFCNNSNNEKENEITLTNRWSMTSIHQLGRTLWFPPLFHSGLRMHMDAYTFITNAAQVWAAGHWVEKHCYACH